MRPCSLSKYAGGAWWITPCEGMVLGTLSQSRPVLDGAVYCIRGQEVVADVSGCSPGRCCKHRHTLHLIGALPLSGALAFGRIIKSADLHPIIVTHLMAFPVSVTCDVSA